MSNVKGLSQPEEKSLTTLIGKYADVFSQGADDISRTNLVRHSIDTGSSTQIKQVPTISSSERREEDARQYGKQWHH